MGLLDDSRLALRAAQLLPDGDEHHLAHGTVEVILLGKAVLTLGACCDATQSRVCAELPRGNGLQVHHPDGDELGCELVANVHDLIWKLWAHFLEDGADDFVLSVNVGKLALHRLDKPGTGAAKGLRLLHRSLPRCSKAGRQCCSIGSVQQGQQAQNSTLIHHLATQ